MSFRQVLIVDDDPGMRQMLTLLLRSKGYLPASVEGPTQAVKEFEARPYDAVLCDVRLGERDGLWVLDQLLQRVPDLTVVMMSAYGSEETAVEAMKRGAYDYISKPFRPDEVVLVLRKAEERERLRGENLRLRRELGAGRGLAHLIGQSPVMIELGRQLRKAAAVTTTVLLTGESGTGKELAARALHDLSPRASMPFVAVNCGAIPDDLIESELFGHLKGAFTNASANKKGLFAEADRGTIFLDEIGDLPYPVQAALLRTLQEDEIRRVGDTQSTKVDVRVVAATARDLEADAEAGVFRRDLFYRLNVLPVRLPPLRERSGDLPLLVTHFLTQLNRSLRRQPPVVRLSRDALDLLSSHRWPGNVRELENLIERAMVMADGEVLEATDFAGLRVSALAVNTGLSIKRGVRILELDLIQRALRETAGNRTKAAVLLEISHRALLYKIKEYGLGARSGPEVTHEEVEVLK